ncbi:MAG: hypothetical protein JWM28_3866, partial [Chitinophagaceae bacterium]|nr:hypothetical protein [Chitinophagaceae bacterium]
LSCSKDSDKEPAPPPSGPYIKYTAGTSQFEFRGSFNDLITGKPGVYVSKFPGLDPTGGNVTRYVLSGQPNPTDGIRFEIEVDSLKTGSYSCYEKITLGGAPKIGFSGKAYSTFKKDGSEKLSVIISRYSNGTIDGTFSGTLYSFDVIPIPIEITKGEFKNVEAVYY